jgi:3-hydroxyacyl-CoA dehydrogenase/enoyl-CoA hydratase/3-hydroxybutyryl-CoA epimerase/3-hydroxyacyl-CoA dehydrogenase/enoyl-CoA hydratase/3-hydroxybutyryl-CoA epimerase/enoyl-CoA isomerase
VVVGGISANALDWTGPNFMASSEPSISLSFPESDIALLTLDMPGKGANILSRTVLDELSQHFDSLNARTDLAGLVITSGKPGMFIAGADLREFATSLDVRPEQTVQMCRTVQTLFQRLSQTPFVTVVAIDGVCVGGGAELAFWCDRRIMSDGARSEIGFPEVKLGLFPGWGGTVRAPRIIGLANAVEMITSGESIGAHDASQLGLVSDVVPADDLLPAAIRLIRAERLSGEYLRDRTRWNGPLTMSDTELGFLGATASAVIQQHTKGHYPAPQVALEVMLGAVTADVNQACQMEAEGIAQLFGSPINAALLNVFFLTDRNKKDTGVDREGIAPRTIEAASVIGAGIMGSGIAAANVKRGIPVTITDANRSALAHGVTTIMEEVSFNRKTRKPDLHVALKHAALLNASVSDGEIATSDLIIEAVVENMDVKRQIYRRLEPQLKPTAILASNTSTIPITRLAEHLERPEQFCGIHFFNPVRKMKLVEVIRGAKTSDETVATAVAHAKRLGKSPIVVNDGPGFLVNRLLLPYMNEALELLTEGASISAIERAAKSFGMPIGPISLYDVVGLDTAFYAGRTMWEAFPDRIKASPILPALVKAGRLGQKSGRGFFSFENKKRHAEPDPELAKYIDPYMTGAPRDFDKRELEDRLFLPMLLEATRVLDEGIVRDVRDIDLGLIFGIGFPPFRGGLLFWADTLGAARIVERLKPLEHLGVRMQPTAMLQRMAAEGRKFYDANK